MTLERPIQRYLKCDSCGTDRRVTETVFMNCKHVLCILCHEDECPLCARERARTDVGSTAP